MSTLNIWPRVIFVDWHGVLSQSQFWYSIPEKRKDTCALAARNVRTALFEQQSPDLSAWMRGQLSTSAVVETYGQVQGSRASDVSQSLRLVLEDECRRGPINESLIDALRRWAGQANLVIATDNMDFFASAAWARPDIREFVDDILSSADVGVLKSDDSGRFFDAYLRRANLSWKDAVLVDDSLDNCARFESRGGRSIHVERYEDAGDAVSSALSQLITE